MGKANVGPWLEERLREFFNFSSTGTDEVTIFLQGTGKGGSVGSTTPRAPARGSARI